MEQYELAYRIEKLTETIDIVQSMADSVISARNKLTDISDENNPQLKIYDQLIESDIRLLEKLRADKADLEKLLTD